MATVQESVEAARVALDAYVHKDDCDTISSAIGDLIADLFHLASEHGVSEAELVDHARRHFYAECVGVGSKVTWLAEGKGARADKVAGMWVTGTVEAFRDDPEGRMAHVKGDYPTMFDGHMVPVEKLRRADA